MKHDGKLDKDWIKRRVTNMSKFDLVYAHGQGYEEGTLDWCKNYNGKGLWGNNIGQYFVVHNGKRIQKNMNLEDAVNLINSLD